ncbi:unnamed protein product [Trichobilharzia regenti]|nr:unnamed protein product [Trichobilharzia regenti]
MCICDVYGANVSLEILTLDTQYCVYQNNPTKNLDGSNTTNTSDKPTSSTNSSSNKWIQMPQDCRYTLWTDWSGCSATCGPGTMTRVRERISPQLDNCQTLLPDVEQRTTCFLKAC